MASIRQHRDRLLIDYRESGSRQRVYTKLSDTPANRAQLQRVADRVDAAIDSGGDIKSLLEKAGLLQPAAAEQVDEPPAPVVLVQRAQAAPAPTPNFETFANL